MIQKLKHLFAIIAIGGALFAPIAMAGAVSAAQDCTGAAGGANIQGCLTTGACLGTTDANCAAASDPNGGVNRIITTVINIFSLVVGVVAVIMIIIGGLRYITAGGEAGNVTAAKNTILYAIIGLVVVALAQIIVQFVLAKVSNTAG